MIAVEQPDWVGLAAPEAVQRLAGMVDELQTLSLRLTPSESTIQSRMALSEEAKEVIQEAKELRERDGIPFWDAVVAMSQHRSLPMELLRGTLHHNIDAGRVQHVDRKSAVGGGLRQFVDKHQSSEVIALLSRVECYDGVARHIPMLDFRWRSSEENLQKIVSIVRDLGHEGLMLDSGNSFHFYGTSLVTNRGLVGFLGKALLLGPMLDRRWVAHQLIEDTCALRISEDAGNGRVEPRVVAFVSP